MTAALSDFVVIIRGQGALFTAGPPLVKASLERWGRPRAEVEAEILTRLGHSSAEPLGYEDLA